jgi:polyisoprenoid-binding protein YceI
MVEPGIYTLGPDTGKLTVRTGKAGAAAKAGHNLLIEVTSWRGTLRLDPEPAQSTVTLTVDSSSLAVREGSGGIQALGEDDRAGIEQTIDDEVLKRTTIEFRSSAVEPGPDRLSVRGDLELAERTAPVAFDLSIGDGDRLTGSATIKQTDWGIKPYSALFGTLKVADAIEVAIDATLSNRPGGL